MTRRGWMGAWLVCLAGAGSSLVLRGEEAVDFARYKVIVDRAPFGAVVGGSAASPQPAFVEKFMLDGVVPDVDGTRMLAVIEDREHNRVELKAEGEEIGDVKVVSIAVAEQSHQAKVELRRGLETATLTFRPRPGVGTAPPGIPGMPPPGMTGDQPYVKPGVILPSRRRVPYQRVDQ